MLLDPPECAGSSGALITNGAAERCTMVPKQAKEQGHRHRSGLLPAVGGGRHLTEDMLLGELGFLDDPAKTAPASIPWTALWLSQAWQQRVLEELDGLANAVADPQRKLPDWARRVHEHGRQGDDRSPWRRQICSAERKSSRRRNIRQRQELTTDGAHDSPKPPRLRRTARLGPAAAQCIEATTDHVADTHPQWIPSGLVDQRLARSTIIAGALLLVLGVAAAISR